jgi:superfamily II DNA helicase RecQ
LQDASFEKDGKEIAYRVARLLAKPSDSALATVLMKEELEKRKPRKKEFPKAAETLSDPASQRIEEELKLWRTAKAKERAIPPYCVFSNQVMRNIAVARPSANADLLAIPGIGPTIVRTYGDDILKIVQAVPA